MTYDYKVTEVFKWQGNPNHRHCKVEIWNLDEQKLVETAGLCLGTPGFTTDEKWQAEAEKISAKYCIQKQVEHDHKRAAKSVPV